MLLWWNWQTRWFKVPVGDHEGSSPSGSTICGRGGMADTLDLGSSVARRKGSSPFARTNKKQPSKDIFHLGTHSKSSLRRIWVQIP